MSAADEKWTEDVFKGFGKPFDEVGTFISSFARAALLTKTQITLNDFGAAADRIFSQSKAPKDREFGGYVSLLLRPLLMFS